MSTTLDTILARAELAASPYADGRHSMTVDLVSDDSVARSRLQEHQTVMRALADQTTGDNPGLMPVTPIAQPIVAASAPVLSALSSPLRTGIGRPTIGGLIRIGALLDPPEKNPAWPTVDGSETVPSTTHMAVAGLNLSRQIEEWALLGPDYDTAITAAVLERLEAALLADLATGGTAAADLAATLAACSPPATHVLGSLADLSAGAAALATLAQAGVGVTAIATPNLTGKVLVVCRPAVVLSVTVVQMGQTVEPHVLGVAVAGWSYGVAAPMSPSAVQVVT